jgi:hypothetical protein
MRQVQYVCRPDFRKGGAKSALFASLIPARKNYFLTQCLWVKRFHRGPVRTVFSRLIPQVSTGIQPSPFMQSPK